MRVRMSCECVCVSFSNIESRERAGVQFRERDLEGKKSKREKDRGGVQTLLLTTLKVCQRGCGSLYI